MKKSLLLAVAFVTLFTIVKGQSSTDPVLMTVGGEKVTLSEFKYIFTKNSNDSKITKESLDEYMELFIKFKLKVREAKDMKMDTVASFRNELNGYVDQLAIPYLKDKESEAVFVKEVYDRSKSDLKIRHILITLPACPTPADTLAAWNTITKIKKDIAKSKNFEDAAKKLSQDTTSAKNGGLLGYYTVMSLYYPFETMAYSLKAGEVSNPVRSSQGYHLIKVDEIRPARGKVKIAHIFVRAEKDEAANKKAKARIEEAYSKLNNKEDWATVCKTYSDDLKTAPTGGELPEFGINQMVQEFEDAAFGLKNAGDYSVPFESPYGWHILKLVNKPKQPSFEDSKTDLEKSFGKSKRFDYVKHAFVNKLKKEYNVVENKDFLKKLEDLAVANKMNLEKSALQKFTGMTLFTYKGGEVKSTELINSVTEKLGDGKSIDFCSFKKKNYDEYISNKLMSYKKTQLPAENYDFKMLVNEYTEGILLFNLMDQNVWTKSVKDTAGLKAFHEKNKDKYMWGDRAQVYIVDLKNDTVEKAARKLAPKVLAGKMTKDKFLATLNKKIKDNVFIIDGLYTKGENSMVENVGFKTGISATEKKDGKTRFAIVYKMRAPEPKTLKEAKGLIISDYQTYLEEDWIRQLRAKYPVTVNKDVLYTLITK